MLSVTVPPMPPPAAEDEAWRRPQCTLCQAAGLTEILMEGPGAAGSSALLYTSH